MIGLTTINDKQLFLLRHKNEFPERRDFFVRLNVPDRSCISISPPNLNGTQEKIPSPNVKRPSLSVYLYDFSSSIIGGISIFMAELLVKNESRATILSSDGGSNKHVIYSAFLI